MTHTLRHQAFERALPWRAGLKRVFRRFQRGIILSAIAAILAGCWLSVDRLALDWSDLQLGPLLVVTVIVVPLSIAYSAVNMMLMGYAAGAPIGFRGGVKVSILAQFAELLPLPGGALVRSAALVRAGSSAARSAGLVIAFSLLWIAFGALGAGLALAATGWPAEVLAFVGIMAGAGAMLWLAGQYGASIAAAAALLRVFGVALIAWRFVLTFAAIGISMSGLQAATFAFATIAGSAASLVPAGLGVTEGLSALLARPAGVAPAAAFLAAVLSRVLGLGMNAVFALMYIGARKQSASDATHA
jgi:hypothetical protein